MYRAWVFAALCASGCALTNMTLEAPNHAQVTRATAVGDGREIALIVPFTDARPTPARCGMKKNGWNMDTADILCSEPPNQWLGRLLADELRKAGFRVVSDPGQLGPNALQIAGTLTQFFLEPDLGGFTVGHEADIGLQLVATTSSGLTAERRFYTKGRETSFWGREYNYQLAANAAVSDLLVRVLDAVSELVQQYPDLGRPAHVVVQP